MNEQAELYHAVRDGTRPFHSGQSGLATLEVVLAILESGRTHRDVDLKLQTEADEDFDETSSTRPDQVVQIA